jgi:hypothetical protein
VKTQQTIVNVPKEKSDTADIKSAGKQLEIYRWYCKGYRYPVFETLRSLNLADSSVIFSTAFFFPPQDHFYLDTDSANLALLDQLWDLDKENIDHPDEPHTDTMSLKDIMTCKLYPNPVSSILNLEYELKKDALVIIKLFTLDGLPVKEISPKQRTRGSYHETLDLSSLYSRDYILRISANDLFTNEVIIKK